VSGITIVLRQACKDIEALVEGHERFDGDERIKQRLEDMERAWWTYPSNIRAKFPDHIRVVRVTTPSARSVFNLRTLLALAI